MEKERLTKLADIFSKVAQHNPDCLECLTPDEAALVFGEIALAEAQGEKEA